MAQSEYKFDKLNAHNYSIWKIVMESQLKGKDLWDYVEVVKMEDEVDPVNNERAKALMYLSMEPQQIAASGICANAYALWRKIKENHEGAASTLRSSSLAAFLALKYKKNESLVNYAGRFEVMLNQLESTGHGVDEKTKLWVFSNSLPQHLKQSVQMFTIAKPEGTVDELISQLKIHHHMDNHDNDRQNAAYQVNEKHQQPNNKPHYKPMSNITCNYCKKQGHMWRECRKLKADNERKKRFGQANQQRSHQQKPQRQQYQYSQNLNQQAQPQQLPQQNARHQQNERSRQAGAFNIKRHDFSEGKYTWIVDSGASSHITPYKEFLIDYEEFSSPRKIYLGNNESLEAYGRGSMPFTNDEFNGELKKVLWVPMIAENLFSIGRAMEQNCNVEFSNEKSEVLFYRNNELVLRGTKTPESIYFLLHLKPLSINEEPDGAALLGASFEEWHRRLGHCSMDTVKALIRSNAVRGLKISNNEQHDCRACVLGKLCRAHHPQRKQIKASESTAVLHIDTVGPMKKISIGGSRFFILATEEYSGYKLFEAVSSKAAVPDAVKRLINQAELESGRPVKAIMTDNGTEYTNANLQQWISKRGILNYYTATYTPEQNGRAERANRTILDGIRTLLSDSDLPEELWAEALNTIVYTTNRILSNNDRNKTRYELFKNEKPDIGNLRIFGQKAIIRESDSNRAGKLAPRGEDATFVGYTDRYNTYRFYLDKPVQQVIISCDVKFINKSSHKQIQPSSGENSASYHDDDDTEIDENPHEFADPISVANEVNGGSDSDDTIVQEPNNEDIAEDNSGPALVGVRDGAMFTLDDEPRTIKDAQESSDWQNWKNAMDEEIAALEKNKTWVLVDKPKHIRPIRNKWVYKAKLKPDGSIERFKARLVAKGFTQIENVDYKETYAPVASMTTIRMFLAIANQNSMHIVQFDIKTAFLYGDLEEELYMEQPEFYKKDPDKICRLIKSLYGLKQAPRQWNKKFDSFLKIFNLEQSCIDRCLYFSKDRSMLLAIYVDDGLAAGRDKKQLGHLIDYLKDNFELKVMDCESYLGFEITRDLKARTLGICQASYVDKVLNRFGMNDCKPASTPEEVGAKFNESPLLPTDNQFKELVGSLLYLTTCSRPDIAHAVSIASRTAQPTEAHWTALKRILRYLKGTRDLGIRFRWENPNKLIGYSDADYANDVETRKSTTGYCIFFGGAPINWRCQRQPIITLSTTEAEYVAGCELVKEILPIRQQLIELKQTNENEPTKIYIDNQSTVRIASSEGGQNRTKHIDIREKWLTEQVMNKKIDVEHISGDEQAADMLTKPLYKTKFITNRSRLMTQIVAALALITMCLIPTEARQLKFTDPLTPVKSDKVLIKGDTRYRSLNIFINPCDHLFNYSTTIYNTEHMIKYCYDYFERKHFRPLTNCKRQSAIGPDLKFIPSSYNCGEGTNSSDPNLQGGKCDVTRRQTKYSLIQAAELDNAHEAWNQHKKFINNIPSLRPKRFVPAMAVGGLVLLGLIAGPAIRTYRITNINAENIEKIANITELHTQAIRDSAKFFEDYKNSVDAIHAWTEDIEERLGEDPLASRLNADPVYRGKRANLVKSYMKWFDTQEKLLQDINSAASVRRIPASMKTMLNGTDNFGVEANLSILFECNYRLENKNMVLELDFLLPTVDQEVDILKVHATDTYVHKSIVDEAYKNSTDEYQASEMCWETYTGPLHVMHNKTNNCIKPLKEKRISYTAIRGQTCLEPVNTLYYPTNRSELWTQDECSLETPKLIERIQIEELDGFHKIYCYPFTIKINEDEEQKCPNQVFMLEGHANYRIENITHDGAYFDTTISRHVRSITDRKHGGRSKRFKRSPMPPASTIVTGLPTTTNPPAPVIVTKQVIAETTTIPTAAPRMKIGETLNKLSGSMNLTLGKIKNTLKLLPEKLNITRANLDSVLDIPFDLISDGFEHLSGYIKSLGSVVGILTAAMVFILIMPAIEIMMVGFKIAKIPVNIWLGSARRISTKLKWVSSNGLDNLPKVSKLFQRRKKRWNEMYKMT